MSPKLYLVLSLLALGAYLFWLTREQLVATQTRKMAEAYGKAVLAAVEKHFVELKDKSVFSGRGQGVSSRRRFKVESRARQVHPDDHSPKSRGFHQNPGR